MLSDPPTISLHPHPFPRINDLSLTMLCLSWNAIPPSSHRPKCATLRREPVFNLSNNFSHNSCKRALSSSSFLLAATREKRKCMRGVGGEEGKKWADGNQEEGTTSHSRRNKNLHAIFIALSAPSTFPPSRLPFLRDFTRLFCPPLTPGTALFPRSLSYFPPRVPPWQTCWHNSFSLISTRYFCRPRNFICSRRSAMERGARPGNMVVEELLPLRVFSKNIDDFSSRLE